MTAVQPDDGLELSLHSAESGESSEQQATSWHGLAAAFP